LSEYYDNVCKTPIVCPIIQGHLHRVSECAEPGHGHVARASKNGENVAKCKKSWKKAKREKKVLDILKTE